MPRWLDILCIFKELEIKIYVFINLYYMLSYVN